MNVIDHEPHSWFLFDENGELFLDASCEHGAVGYSVLIQLNYEEVSKYSKEGRSYLNSLALQIHESAPGVIGSWSPYKSRNLTPLRKKDVMNAVRRWQEDDK